MPKTDVTDEQVYQMYLTARREGGQPREEALIEVADHLLVDEYDVMDAIDRYRAAKGLKPIEWE